MRVGMLGACLAGAMAAAAAADPRDRLTFLAAYEDAVGFEGASDVAISPDGRFAYPAAAGDGAITMLARDAATGVLTTRGVTRVGVDGAQGIAAVHALAVTPDGTTLYARGGENGHATLVVFARDVDTGALAFVEESDVGGPPDSEIGRAPMVVSPDGAWLYVLESDRIGVFERNTAGGLAHVAEMRDGDQDGAVDGLRDVRDIAISPDGLDVYTVAAGEDGVPLYGDQVVAPFRRDPATGLLTLARTFTLDERRQHPGGYDRLAMAPDGAHVYAIQLTDPRRLVTFARDAATGLLDERGAVALPVPAPDLPALRIAPDGASVYVTAPEVAAGGYRLSLLAYARDAATGALSPVGATATGATQAGTPAVAPDGRHVYLPGALPGRAPPGAVVLFARDVDSGALRREGPQGTAVGLEGLDSVSRVVVSPDGHHVYALSSTEGAVVAFARAEDGRLSSRGRLPGLDAHDVSEMTTSPDGRHVYLLRSDRVDVAAREPDGGGLTMVGTTPIPPHEYETLSSPLMSPDGRFLYVLRGSYERTTIIPLRRDRTAGTLVVAARRRIGTEPRTISAMAIAPRGRAMYVGGTFVVSADPYGERAVAVLRRMPRDAGSGALGPPTRLWRHDARPNRRAAIVGLTSSPDGRHLYANAPGDRLAVFALRARPPSRRRALRGESQPTELHDLALTPDGAHAAALSGSWVHLFARNAANGRLAVVDSVADADGGPLLADATDLALSPDGRHVYVASPARDAVTAFALDTTGTGD